MTPSTNEIPDQFYWVTSRLAANGHQRTTLRTVAASILALGLPSAVAAANPASGIRGARATTAMHRARPRDGNQTEFLIAEEGL